MPRAPSEEGTTDAAQLTTRSTCRASRRRSEQPRKLDEERTTNRRPRASKARRASDPPALLSFFPSFLQHLHKQNARHHLQPVNLQQIRKRKQHVDPLAIVSYYVFYVCSFQVKHLSYDTPRRETKKGRAQALFRRRRAQKARGHVQKSARNSSASPARPQEAPEAPTRGPRPDRAIIIRIM